MQLSHLQWLLVVGSSLALWWVAPRARTAEAFYAGRARERAPGFWTLLASLVISWLFAKSLTVAANLGLAYGLVGGVGYACYYLSFGVAGLVLYRLRTRGGFASIHDFLRRKHGPTAVALFSVLIALRLFNEVWSNTMVIGSYFGDAGTTGYYAAVLVFTALTLAYSLKGGMGSSLLTDAVQMGLFAVLLAGLLGLMAGAPPPAPDPAAAPPPQTWGAWTLAGGLDFVLLALVQVLSYPFHDPVLTDRAFLGAPRPTRRAFLWAVPVGIACIVLFSLVGVYARALGLEGEAPVAVARSLGVGALLVVNLIMVTSAASTLDSTFSSWAKLAVVDLGLGRPTVAGGRWAMVALVLAGTVPVFLGADIISATTISGLMVVGLAPVFLLWRLEVPPWSFHVSALTGVAFGLGTLALGYPDWMRFGETKYAGLLGASVTGTALAFVLFAGSRVVLPGHPVRLSPKPATTPPSPPPSPAPHARNSLP